MRKTFVLALVLAGAAVAATPATRQPAEAAAGQPAATADLVLLNGHVITVDPRDRIAQAVAIAGDRILAVGSNEEVRKLIGPATRQIDLKGLTVTPGLLDAHAHFASGGVNRLFTLDLSYPDVKNLADVRTKVAERVARAAPGDWIDGRGWDEGKLE